jgi:PDZ domain-containing protein
MAAPLEVDEHVSRPDRFRGGWLIALVLVLGLAALGSSEIRVPYYAISPGDALPVSQLVKTKGTEAYPPKGTVFLVTVGLGQVSALDALRGWRDPDVDVLPKDKIVPKDEDREQFRRLNLKDMDESKQKAIGVALEHLGYDAIKGKGAAVAYVAKGRAADGVLRLKDVITAVDGAPIDTDDAAIGALGRHHPGDRVTLTVRRDGGEVQVAVTVGSRPGARSKPYLGVILQTVDLRFDLPFDVDIDSAEIGGPSAGLAFTLEVLDVLTPGELTGGHTVATTGTIEVTGRVGAVGGVPQKTAAVCRSGAEIFLVPKSELVQARQRACPKLRVEGVDTLDDALRILASLGGNGLSLGRPGAERS